MNVNFLQVTPVPLGNNFFGGYATFPENACYPTVQSYIDMMSEIYPDLWEQDWNIDNKSPRILQYMNDELKNLIADRDHFNNSIKVLTNQIIEKCPHPDSEIVEALYDDDTPPYRICKICGLAEEGWGKGYSVLDPNIYCGSVPKITRSEAKLLTRKYIFQNPSTKFGK